MWWNKMDEGTRHWFVMSALTLAMTELFVIAAVPDGLSSLWKTSPSPMWAFAFFFLFGVVMPLANLFMLWLSQHNLKRFVLLTIAALTALPSVLGIVGVFAWAIEPRQPLTPGIPIALSACLVFLFSLHRWEQATKE
jgi:hypothetical protein